MTDEQRKENYYNIQHSKVEPDHDDKTHRIRDEKEYWTLSDNPKSESKDESKNDDETS